MTASLRRLSRRTLATAVLSAATGAALLATTPVAALADEPGSGSSSTSPADAEKAIVHLQIQYRAHVEYPSAGRWVRSTEPVVLDVGQCSGWFADSSGHIVTAGHCVEDDPAEIRTEILTTYLADSGIPKPPARALAGWRVVGVQGEAEPTRIVRASQPSTVEGSVLDDPLTAEVLDWRSFHEGDVALLKINNLEESTPYLSVATEPATPGDEVTAIGYPGNVQDVTDVDRLRASFKSGTVSSVQTSPTGVSTTEINAEVAPGMSGGPTVDADGAVIGVNSSYLGDLQNFNFITDGTALRTFLEHRGVDLHLSSGEGGTTGEGTSSPALDPAAAAQGADSSTWPYAAGAGALLVAAGGAFLQRRRPAPATASVASVASAAPAARSAGRPAPAEATRFVGRPEGFVLSRTPVVQRATCTHAGNAPGTRFCRDCGHRLG
jgi:serine protease Do